MSSGCNASDAVRADMESARFVAGVVRRYWRVVSYAFPVLIVTIAAIEPTGEAAEYAFRFELSGFPNVAPEAHIWDIDSNAPLPVNRRPKGSARVAMAFQDWGDKSVYRPWDRRSGAHNNWAAKHPTMTWNASRDLAFPLEDLHGLLTSNPALRRAG
jgi:hypothetical protein